MDTKSGDFYLFPLVALRYRHVRKSNFDAELKMLFLRAILCIRMKFQTTFLGRYITTNFISAHVACTTLLLLLLFYYFNNNNNNNNYYYYYYYYHVIIIFIMIVFISYPPFP